MLVKYKGPTGVVHNEKHGFLETDKKYEFTKDEAKALTSGQYKDLFETGSTSVAVSKPEPPVSESKDDKPKKVAKKKKSKKG